MTVTEMSERAGVATTSISLRMKQYPGLPDEVYAMPTEQFRDNIPYRTRGAGNLFTTEDGVTVNIRILAEQLGITIYSMRKRIRKCGGHCSYDFLSEKAYSARGGNEFEVPGIGVRNLYWIADYVGIDRGTLRARLDNNPEITWQELTRKPRHKLKVDKFQNESDSDGVFEDYSWSDLKIWYRDCGKHCENALIILRDMLRLKNSKDAIPIMKRLEEMCA